MVAAALGFATLVAPVVVVAEDEPMEGRLATAVDEGALLLGACDTLVAVECTALGDVFDVTAVDFVVVAAVFAVVAVEEVAAFTSFACLLAVGFISVEVEDKELLFGAAVVVTVVAVVFFVVAVVVLVRLFLFAGCVIGLFSCIFACSIALLTATMSTTGASSWSLCAFLL